MSQDAPIAFISYKWEDEETKHWVEGFAKDLLENGVDAKLDVWEVKYGESWQDYMTASIQNADFVLFIVTPSSVRAVEQSGGKGAFRFEVQLANTRKLAGHEFRFIPILLRGERPPFILAGVRYVNFRRDDTAKPGRIQSVGSWTSKRSG